MFFNKDVSRFAEYARRVWNVENVDDYLAAEEGIAKTEEYFLKLGMPNDFSGLGIGVLSEGQIWAMVDGCTQGGRRKIGDAVPLSSQDIFNIFNSVNR